MAPTSARAICKSPRKKHHGLAIADSKKLYNPAAGLEHLERGALGMLSLLTERNSSLRSLLGCISPSVVAMLDSYPWYRGCDVALPVTAEAAGLRIRCRHVASILEKTGIRLAWARSEILPVGQYNARITSTDNKATTLLDQTCSLIDSFWRYACGNENLTILVDRQGGRQHYLRILQRLFPSAGLKILDEQNDNSSYRLTMDGRVLEVHFLVEGEDCHMPIALASMISKYIRELFMKLENQYWAGQMAGKELKPTAGYYTDGKRFLADISETAQRLKTPMELLVRNR